MDNFGNILPSFNGYYCIKNDMFIKYPHLFCVIPIVKEILRNKIYLDTYYLNKYVYLDTYYPNKYVYYYPLFVLLLVPLYKLYYLIVMSQHIDHLDTIIYF